MFNLEAFIGWGEGVRWIERKLITQVEENKIMRNMIKKLMQKLNDWD